MRYLFENLVLCRLVWGTITGYFAIMSKILQDILGRGSCIRRVHTGHIDASFLMFALIMKTLPWLNCFPSTVLSNYYLYSTYNNSKMMPQSKELRLRSEVKYLMRCIFWMKDFSDGQIPKMLSRYVTLSNHGPTGRKETIILFILMSKWLLFLQIISTKSICIILRQNLLNIW